MKTCSNCARGNPPEHRFCGHCGAELASMAAAVSAERRFLTVMMIDLAGSTQLTDEADLEDVRELVDSYHRLVSILIEGAGGYVAKFMGDGVMAFFGYPQLIERPAVAAVEAGLQIVEQWANAGWEPRPAVRVGIDSGEVILDSTSQAASRSAQDVTGEPANVAARVESLAPHDGVTITERTRQLIGGEFELVDRGLHTLRGVAEPLALYDVVARARQPVFEMSPFVGRQDEMAMLGDRYDRARGGASPALLIHGEAGLGKSRLVAEFLSTVEPKHVLTVRGRSDQAAVPFSPFIESLSWRPPPGGRRQILDGVASMLAVRLGAGPSLLVLEDVHWFDASSLDVVVHLLENVPLAGTMTIITTRHVATELEVVRDRVEFLALRGLSVDAAGELASALSAWDDADIEVLVERAEGVPLFVEQLARFADTSTAPASRHLPATIHELLAMQLDRLGPARNLAQLASVFGRSFPVAELSRLDDSGADITADLSVLTASGLIELPDGSDTAWFRHALMRDVAYRSLLRRERRVLHGRVADLLDERGGEEPAVLALHRSEAGDFDEAANLWLAAVHRALTDYAFVEADRAARAALDALAELPESADRDQRELATLLLAAPTVMLNQASSPDVEGWFDRARELAVSLGDESDRLIALSGISAALSQAGRHRDADEIGAALPELANRATSNVLRLIAFAQQGMNRFNVGDLRGAEALLSIADSVWDPTRHDSLARRVPLDPGGWAAADLVAIELFTGRRTEGLARASRLLDEMSRWTDGHGRALGTGLLARVRADVGDHDASEALARDALDLAIEHGAIHIELQMRCLLDAASIRAGDRAGRDHAFEAIDSLLDVGMAHSWTSMATAVAEAFVDVGDDSSALTLVDHALEFGRSVGELYALPKALLIRSRALAQSTDQRASRDAAEAALRLAEEQGNVFHATEASGLLVRI